MVGRKDIFRFNCEFLPWFSSHSYRLQRSCGQGYVFTRVCDSVNRGEGVWGRPPRADTPPGADTPLEQTPQSRHPPEQTPREQMPPRADTPWSRHPRRRHPPEQTPPPPREQTLAYDLRAAGTHPTGMHSCLLFAGRCLIWVLPLYLIAWLREAKVN